MAQIIPLEPITSLDDPGSSLHRATLAVSRSMIVDLLGDDDLAMRPHNLILHLRQMPEWENFMAVAVEDGQVVGYTDGGVPLRDNLTQCEVNVTVHPDHRHQGVGKQLLDWAEQWGKDRGRTTFVTWVLSPRLEDGEPTVVAPTGDVFPSGLPGWQFAAANGYALEQIERINVQKLPVDNLDKLRDEALAKADGYKLHTWIGAVPEEWIDSFAELRSQVSVDAPSAGLENEREIWDADRVRRGWTVFDSMGFHRILVAVEHEASGHLVGFTQLTWHTDHQEHVDQGYTFVRSDHRGHQLGLLLKVAALEALATACPKATRVQTDNAGENSYMLAINHAMGYQLVALAGSVQKKLA